MDPHHTELFIIIIIIITLFYFGKIIATKIKYTYYIKN